MESGYVVTVDDITTACMVSAVEDELRTTATDTLSGTRRVASPTVITGSSPVKDWPIDDTTEGTTADEPQFVPTNEITDDSPSATGSTAVGVPSPNFGVSVRNVLTGSLNRKEVSMISFRFTLYL